MSPPMRKGEESVSSSPWIHLGLFLATAASVFLMGYVTSSEAPSLGARILSGLEFAGTLLAILVAHEFGHYIAARIHRVDASLPYFLPMPLLSPFGTMGAIIRMRGSIGSRKALLDIGASGPLAGMAFAIPLYVLGTLRSTIVPAGSIDGAVELGAPLLTRLIDHLVNAPKAPEGMTVLASPIYFGAWGGMLITWLNLLPVGQLDGGHVAYALFGVRQDRIAPWIHRALLASFFVGLAHGLVPDLQRGIGLLRIGHHVSGALFWLMWFEMLAILGSLSQKAPSEKKEGGLSVQTRAVAALSLMSLASFGRTEKSLLFWGAWFAGLAILIVMEAKWGALRTHDLFEHPTAEGGRLGAGRTLVAILTLAFFLLLFMTTPLSMG